MSSKLSLIVLVLLATSCNRANQSPTPQGGDNGVTTIAKGKRVYTGTEGGKCKVVSGDNKGKKGKYDSEGDCAGSWGFTGCKKDGKDNGKCADAKSVTVLTGDHLSVANVTLLNDAGEPVNCTVLLPDRGAASPKCQPADVATLEDLDSSDDELDRRVAAAIKPLLKGPASK